MQINPVNSLSPEERLTQRRNRLLFRIHRRYETVTEQLVFGDIELPFTRIADPNRVLDQVAEQEARLDRLHGRNRPDELLLPYWAQLWDSAAGVAHWLVSHLRPRANLRVLDLGCGMGLAGTIAARRGCWVTFADLDCSGLLFSVLNSLPDAERVRTRKLNWQTEHLDERFDLILGADILYERIQWPHLERFWSDHLAHDGAILLGEPGRQTGEQFIEWIRRFSWRVYVSEQPVSGRDKPIRLITLRRRRADHAGT